ncbi:MAG TPA: AmmeMemoRadiSam system protein B [Vicinamibacteria bacterium]|nr:AmmeMemoRadiSam system protein B [Vicinamibacteria bacterium]
MKALPRLRHNLDLMPSPVADRPGLLVRDPYGYADGVLIIPPPLVPCLLCFDGEKTEGDLREALVRITGELEVGELLRHLTTTLDEGGFLDNAALERRRASRHQAFAEAPRRVPSHAGAAYPAEGEALRRQLDAWIGPEPTPAARPGDGLVGIAAPHVSPEGGHRSFAAAYAALPPSVGDRTFVILGTSHYGVPGRFGLTRKRFATPLGDAEVDAALVGRLADSGGAALVEDYCHAVEHSIEFQVVFLQHRFTPGVRIVPILCGPFAPDAGAPDADEAVAAFFEALAAEAASRRDLVFVLGVDMAHVGRRYGDRIEARAGKGAMVEVERRDRERLERVAAADADGFWRLLADGEGDALRWCGASPLYTFLRVARPARGELLRYEQWNIDETSVVSFAGMAFYGDPAGKEVR